MHPLDLILEAIHQNLHPIKIILFGSHAKGTAKEGSDLDIAVIQKEKPNVDQKIKVDMALLKKDYNWKVQPDLHLFSVKEFEARLKENDLFVSEIVKGKTLYDNKFFPCGLCRMHLEGKFENPRFSAHTTV